MVTIFGRAPGARPLSASFILLSALLSSGCVSQSWPMAGEGLAGTGATGDGAAGTGATPNQPDPNEPPLTAAEIGARVFGDESVIEVRLTLSDADRLSLELHGDEEEYFPAQASLTTTAGASKQLSQIGVRHKGAYSLHHCFDDRTGARSYQESCARLSYKLEFDEFTPDERFDGLKRLNLHASSGDATRMREMLAYGLYRDFGVTAPRTAVAKVYVNGEYEGLFIAVEEIDGRFTKAHFADGGDGNLYKEIWPSEHLNPRDLVGALRTNEDVGDVSGFMDFSNAMARAQPATFAADSASWLDLEHTLRYVAVDRALKNWDGIMAFYSKASPHNFYWYHDTEGSGRFQLIPWDMDNTSWNFDPIMSPQGWVTAAPVPDWNEEPSTCNPRSVWDQSMEQSIVPPRCDRFLDLLAETHFQRFEAIATELLAGPFAAQRLTERVNQLSAVMEPIIEEDPQLDAARWRSERDNFKQLLRLSHQQFESFAAAGLVAESAGAWTP